MTMVKSGENGREWARMGEKVVRETVVERRQSLCTTESMIKNHAKTLQTAQTQASSGITIFLQTTHTTKKP
jgi:hypothetical protein